jgi:hypothetical protein
MRCLQLAAFKTPRRFTVDPCMFTAENGLLTASQKLARQKLRKHYASEIDEMYSISAKLEDNVVDMVMDVLKLSRSDRSDLMQSDFFQAVSICTYNYECVVGVWMPFLTFLLCSFISFAHHFE